MVEKALDQPKSRTKVTLPAKSRDTSNDNYHDSLKDILRSTLEAVQAKHAAVSLIDAENGSLDSCISHGAAPDQETCTSVAHWVATHGQPLSLETQEQALQVPDLVINSEKALPLICLPIQVNGTTIGALQSNFPPPIGQEELSAKQYSLKQAADSMGHIIENATLRRRLQEMRESAREANDISLEIQERECERIILEVHDGIAQTLTSAFQHLQTVDNIGGFQEERSRQSFLRAVALVRRAIQETREVINRITPATLDVLGLVTTVRQELKQFEKETRCQVDFQSATWPSLPRHMEFAIYRIIREAVNNVRKYARSRRLKVELRQEQRRLVIRVQDWGVGFIPDKEESSSSDSSMGLLSMRRRAEFLGSAFEIHSSLGKGTEIRVDIPWLPEEE